MAEAEPAAQAAPPRLIEEIVVTANRRAENVQDVSGGIRVFDGEALEQAGVSGFEDYLFSVPGVDVTDSGTETKIAIRGISNIASDSTGAGSSASPIGLYLDDVPIQGNGVLPDLALYDLERIEVLKGPQGTLYGEGAQGGALKMLLARADPNEFAAKGEAGVGRTRFGGGWNHFQNLSLNVPVRGSWSVRAVGSRRFEAGFVGFPNRGTADENDSTDLMGRLQLEGNVWEGLSLSGLVFHQRQRLDQFPIVQLAEGDLRNRDAEPQFADTDFTLTALTLRYDLGFAELTSATSWFRNDRRLLARFALLEGIVAVQSFPVVGFLEPPAEPIEQEWLETDNHQFSVAEELRLLSSGDSWLDWVVGVFYRKRQNEFDALADNSSSDEPPPVGPGIAAYDGVESFQQLAVFGEGTLDLPWSFELGLGLRGLRESVGLEGNLYTRGPLFPLGVAAGEPDGTSSDSFSLATQAFTPKVALRWFVDDLRMLYVQVANGVRSGGTNVNALISNITPIYEPDSLWSYEVGAKTQWLDGLLTANVAAFHNDWRDLQVKTVQPTDIGGVPIALALNLNVARAFSRGVEVELLAMPIETTMLGFNLFAGNGRIVDGDPAGNIADDTKLPQLAELGYAAFADYRLRQWSPFGFTPITHFDTQFVGDRTAGPPVGGVEPAMKGFLTFNGVVGLEHERWDVTFGVRNLTDERAQVGVLNALEEDSLTIARPRTWTARMAFRF